MATQWLEGSWISYVAADFQRHEGRSCQAPEGLAVGWSEQVTGSAQIQEKGKHVSPLEGQHAHTRVGDICGHHGRPTTIPSLLTAFTQALGMTQGTVILGDSVKSGGPPGQGPPWFVLRCPLARQHLHVLGLDS